MNIVFFEKPGCAGNAKQKALLSVAGHRVEARNLLTYPFTPPELLSYFGKKPVMEWFNRSAPRVKSRAVRPEALSPDVALEMLLCEPTLIRRPLMDIRGKRCVGFDLDFIEAYAGPLPREERVDALRAQVVDGCAGHSTDHRCPDSNASSAVNNAADRS